MEEENKVIELHRTEEVRDIIDRMPHRTGKIVTVCVAVFAGLLVLFGYIIKYPESVSGVATIQAQQSQVRLTSPTTGRLHLLVSNRNEIGGGEMIAYIESGATLTIFSFWILS